MNRLIRLGPSAALRLRRYCTASVPCSAEQEDAQQLVRASAEERVLEAITQPLQHSSSPVRDVRSFGVARVARAMSEQTARLLHDEVLDQLAIAQEHVTGFDDGEEHSQFSAVLAAAATDAAIATGDETRWDLRLQLTEPVRAALHELLRGPVGETLEGLAGGNAALHELAAVVSAPGAAPQVLHPDADWSATASVFSAFVALQDVGAPMGPTLFLRETHTQEAHIAHAAGVAAATVPRASQPSSGCDEAYRAFLVATDARAALLRCGEAVVYDRRLLHAGGRNASADGAARALFYVTFARVDTEDADLWNAYSIRSEYRQTMSLEQLRGSDREAAGERYGAS